MADSNGQQNRKPEEPDARNGRVRICGGAFGGIRGATRQRPPPHFVGPLRHLFRFSLEQASLRAGKLLPFAFDSPSLVPRYGLSSAKTVGTLFGEQNSGVDLHLE